MKYFMKVLGILLAGLASAIIILLLVINHFFFSMSNLPDGEFLTESQSPTGEYTVKAYVSMSGATVADAVRGEAVYHQKRDREKNIYWGYRESTAEIVWIDEHTVSFNGKELDVRKDVYDFRKE
ncbi:DUF5412 family protein [Sporosarcina jiandibaonis]|uniref:DUF5412 family protein n=1 Tax=Sporosarcina jiandibaonis TaxID=2715535 RepID=UPI001FEA8730|nr:DUF5412 family protein [Sporosarcina jiandibaonis]